MGLFATWSLTAAEALSPDPSRQAPALADATRAFQQQRWAEVQTLLAAAPPSGDAHALRGMAAFHLGQMLLAERELSEALFGNTRYSARVLYYQAQIAATQGRTAAATALYAQILKQYPESPEAKALRADAPAAAPAARTAPSVPSSVVPPAAPLAAVRNATESKRAWQHILLLGVYDDSNPRLVAIESPTGEQAVSDWYVLGYAASTWSIPDTRWSLQGGATVLDYHQQNALDFASVSGEARFTVPGVNRWSLAVKVSPQWVARDFFAWQEELQGEYRYTPSTQWETTLKTAAQRKDYREDPSLDGYQLNAYGNLAWTAGSPWLQRARVRATAARDLPKTQARGYSEGEGLLSLEWKLPAEFAFSGFGAERLRHFAAGGNRENRRRLGAELSWSWRAFTLSASTERAVTKVQPSGSKSSENTTGGSLIAVF